MTSYRKIKNCMILDKIFEKGFLEGDFKQKKHTRNRFLGLNTNNMRYANIAEPLDSPSDSPKRIFCPKVRIFIAMVFITKSLLQKLVLKTRLLHQWRPRRDSVTKAANNEGFYHKSN